jgi:hypothetical protein
VVENIPEDKFDEQHVRAFFSEFGNILEVNMQPYKRLALVKYDDWASAKRAYDSPKVIFDNRFVKVYWYKPETIPTPPRNGTAQSATSQPAAAQTEESKIDIEEFKKKQEEVQKAHELKLKGKKELEDKQRELEKRAEELLRNQEDAKRKLQEKLLAKGVTSTESKPKSQTDALKAQLAALQAEADSLGIGNPFDESGRGRGRGRGFRGRGGYVSRGRGSWGRGAPFTRSARGGGAYNLDNRTKKVAVSGVEFDADKDESLRQYLLVSPHISITKYHKVAVARYYDFIC